MEFLSSDQHLEADLLRAISHSDPSAWCFMPLGESSISCCSDAFLKLWHLKDVLPFQGGYRLYLESPHIVRAMTSVGLTNEFLVQIATGVGEGTNRELLLVRSDGFYIRVKWSVVLGSDGLPVGRLVRFKSEMPESISDRMVTQIHEARSRMAILSQREREILNLLYEGHTNKAIAAVTGISEKTVEKYRARIIQKLKLNNTIELVRLVSVARILESRLTSEVAS